MDKRAIIYCLLVIYAASISAYDVKLECIKCTSVGLKYYSYQVQNRVGHGYFCLDSHDIRFRLRPMMLLVEEINEPSKCEEMNVSDMRSPVWELFQSNTTDYQMLREIAFQLSSSLKSDVCASTVLGFLVGIVSALFGPVALSYLKQHLSKIRSSVEESNV